MRLSSGQRVVLTVICFTIAIIGFMIKLPAGLRHIDRQLHATFYFFAAAFLNLLFAKTKLLRHALIFAFLYVFGMVIEHAQSYSNQFFRKRIHGRYDPEDVEWNLKGLLAFSLLWLLWAAARLVYNKSGLKKA